MADQSKSSVNTAPSSLAPPAPFAQFPWVNPNTGQLTTEALRWLQDLWASIQGQGGTFDLNGLFTSSPGLGQMTGLAQDAAQDAAQAAVLDMGPILSRLAGTQEQLEDLRRLIVAAPVLDSSSSSGIPDAPFDGLLYGREDGSWVEVPSTSGAAIIADMVAAVDLSGHRAVLATVAGEADYPDITVLADALGLVGITTGAIAAGASGPVQTSGVMDEGTWAWTAGQPIYCDDAGVLTQSVPAGAWTLQVATAVTSTRIAVEFRTVIALN